MLGKLDALAGESQASDMQEKQATICDVFPASNSYEAPENLRDEIVEDLKAFMDPARWRIGEVVVQRGERLIPLRLAESQRLTANGTPRERARWHLGDIEQDARLAEESMRQLPKTPGRERIERGLQEVREGIKEIKREAEIDR